jgi:hypothetical protein
MSWFESVSPKSSSSASAKPILDAAAMAQLGALSPLWMLFLGASTVGMAYWGMTRWMHLAMPERGVENVVKLRLVKTPAPKPEPEDVKPAAVQLAPVAPVEPKAAPITPPAKPKLAAPAQPKPAKATKTKVLKTAPPNIEPAPVFVAPAASEKPVVKRGRPPKVRTEPAVLAKTEPVAAPSKPKTTGAKRGPKPKPKV